MISRRAGRRRFIGTYGTSFKGTDVTGTRVRSRGELPQILEVVGLSASLRIYVYSFCVEVHFSNMREAIIKLSDEELEAIGYGDLVSLCRERVSRRSNCWRITGYGAFHR